METGGLHLQDLQSQFEEEIKKIRTEEDLLRLKAAYLGKKGHISLFLKGLGDLPVESRPIYGAQANELKERIEEECRAALEKILLAKKERRLREETIDITLPGRAVEKGGLHPLTQLLEEAEAIFREIGFSVFEGPEIETDYYNFEALNIPKDHPARDMQDTFYLGDPCGPEGGYPRLSDSGRASDVPQAPAPRTGKARSSALLLRTHTSPVQIHVMKKMKPPIRMIAPGVVYRRDSDISHTPMFHQVEGLVVGEGIRFSDLKGVVSYFLHRLFDASIPLRFRPSYFPFTEPSAEVDIGCVICRGKKKLENGEACRLCKASGWLEVIGCGMVHPAVFENVGYDTRKVTGFAFGMGIERLTMLKHGIPDIRLFFENDLRFLRQF
jgi:phenylalanyl-tRNA synthetase alpha chain